MEKEEKKQERSYELRSEKVRSIVGQVPPSLVRYGTAIIGMVLLLLVAIAYLLPYKQVYLGTATIYQIPTEQSDSLQIRLLLRFDNKRPTSLHHQPLTLHTAEGTISGTLLQLSPQRDTLDRQVAMAQFSSPQILELSNQTIDFQVTYSQGNLLQRLLATSLP